MRAESLVEALKASPFRPFWLVTADGARFRVDHPEWVATAGGRTAVVVEPDDLTHMLDVGLITRIELDAPAPAGRAREEGGSDR